MSIQAIAAGAESTAANRAGQLSAEQQRRLAATVKAEAMPGLWISGCFAVVFIILIWAQVQSYPPVDSPSELLPAGVLLAITLLVFVWLLGRRQQNLGEVSAGRLARADGHVAWQRGAYRAEVPGRVLNLNTFNLAAGSYTFSFLPQSGRVVSAELVAAEPRAEALDDLRHALAQANHFNLDDLPALRQGNLGQSSRRRLRQLWRVPAGLLLSALVLVMLFVVLVVNPGTKDISALPFVLGMLLGLFGFFAAVGAIRPTLDVQRGQVSTAEGMVQKTIRQTYGRNASTFYYYKLDNQVWLVSAEAYRALLPERAYRIYFLPHSKQLAGIEPV